MIAAIGLSCSNDTQLRSPEDAVDYVKLLQRTLRSAEVTDGNMEDVLLCDCVANTCDANYMPRDRCDAMSTSLYTEKGALKALGVR